MRKHYSFALLSVFLLGALFACEKPKEASKPEFKAVVNKEPILESFGELVKTPDGCVMVHHQSNTGEVLVHSHCCKNPNHARQLVSTNTAGSAEDIQ